MSRKLCASQIRICYLATDTLLLEIPRPPYSDLSGYILGVDYGLTQNTNMNFQFKILLILLFRGLVHLFLTAVF